jgi:diacylglycerol kinase family enzyme
VSIFKPTYKKEISIYLANNCSRFELVIVFGGDGTLNEALNGLMNKTHRPKLLYVPTGTVNDFGHYLKIPKDFKGVTVNSIEGEVEIESCECHRLG